MSVVGRLDLGGLAVVAERAAREGGAVVRRGFRSEVRWEAKAVGDYVTEVDLASEHAIRDVLGEGAPGVGFHGEELGGDRDGLHWLVDPLDGTTNFMRGLPAVGVSVALVEGLLPLVGVVHAPLLGETYVAVRGGGAWNDRGPLRVGDRDSGASVCATGFRFKEPGQAARYLPVFERALDSFEDLRRVGAASLDLAWVAEGVFDGFFELGLGPWDVAAGALLVTEAGGIVTDWSGDPRAWIESGDILAGCHPTHARLLAQAADRPG